MNNQRVIMLILKKNGGIEKNWQLIFYAAKIKDTFKLVANVEYKERFNNKINKDMRINKTSQTVIKGDEENASLYIVSRSFLMAMAEKYDVQPSKLLIGMQSGEMVVQVYDEGAYPVWQTLEIITMLNYG